MFSRSSGVSLFSGGIENNFLSLAGNPLSTENNISNSLIDEFNKIKQFININFMTPLIQQKMDILHLNAFNFEYLLKKLNAMSCVFKDVGIFIKLIESIKSAIEITNENKQLNKIIYGKMKETTLEFKTASVELKPEYQIYVSMYGDPKTFNDFDMTRINKIKHILKTHKSLTYREIEEMM